MVALSSILADHGYRPRAVLHIGANTGAELEEYRSIGIGSGLLIEPVSRTFALLEEKIANFPGFVAEQALISDADDQELTIRISSNMGESSSILALGTHAQHFPGITVTDEETLISRRLDSLLIQRAEINRYDLWVVDVEGAELHVLRGAREALRAAKIIMIEIHDEATHEGAPHWSEIQSFLEPYGFKMKAMNITRYGFGDALFVHNSVSVRALGPSADDNLIDIGSKRPCSQSSLSIWSQSDDAARALTNEDEDFAFHTELEDNPWWCVDLEEVRAVSLIRIFNREGARERAFSLRVEISNDGQNWTNIHENNGWYFGGSATGPLDLNPKTEHFRYLRLSLPSRNYLHLQRVEIFGPRMVTAPER
ncbi:FkbM family methyltransferase [Sphingomonas sp. BIUV-7]|uniref:FkbM family methyltransferase n=1 Tax=Sphingomonas natans TaxID=3063330 RepID=A0ABT8Y5S6_9SPHN|nr:FkbM family methyltransferase [Sphingomonas sp. BIUV-7]MDO6413674.1 FkbM family methyltransferase [Sphingomonas sp. BIUV-7]